MFIKEFKFENKLNAIRHLITIKKQNKRIIVTDCTSDYIKTFYFKKYRYGIALIKERFFDCYFRTKEIKKSYYYFGNYAINILNTLKEL